MFVRFQSFSEVQFASARLICRPRGTRLLRAGHARPRSRARRRLLLPPPKREATSAHRERFVAVPRRPLRKLRSARAWCPRSWRSSSAGVSRPTPSRQAPDAVALALGRKTRRLADRVDEADALAQTQQSGPRPLDLDLGNSLACPHCGSGLDAKERSTPRLRRQLRRLKPHTRWVALLPYRNIAGALVRSGRARRPAPIRSAPRRNTW